MSCHLIDCTDGSVILAPRPGLPTGLVICRAGFLLTCPVGFVTSSPWFGLAGGGEQR